MATNSAPTGHGDLPVVANESFDVTLCTKDPDFFLDDGNVILLAQSTLFRVHKSMLSIHSEIFRDMFRISAGTDESQEVYGGVPIVQMSDSASDLRHLINALYKRSYFQKNDRYSSFDVVEALLALSSKYMIGDLKRDVVEHLRFLFPCYASRLTSLTTLSNDQAVRAIEMGQKYQILDILPAAFLRCFAINLSEILDGTIVDENGTSVTYQLSPVDLRTYLLAKEKAFSFEHNVLSFLTSDAKHLDCRRYCQTPLQEMRNYAIHEGYSDAVFIYDDILLDPNTLSRSTVCPECSRWYKECLLERRETLWGVLPGMLSLPHWPGLVIAASH